MRNEITVWGQSLYRSLLHYRQPGFQLLGRGSKAESGKSLKAGPEPVREREHLVAHPVGIIRPRIVPFSNRMELRLQRHRVGGFQLSLSFRNGFLLSLVGLLLCFPVLSSPVVHKAPGATSTLEVLHLLSSRVHSDFVRLFHL
jgi:hypothetical protein